MTRTPAPSLRPVSAHSRTIAPPGRRSCRGSASAAIGWRSSTTNPADLLGGGDIGIQDQDISSSTGFISGIDRVVDFRSALLDPSTGQLLGTTQVSRYPIGASADLSDGEQVADIAPVDPYLCSPDFGISMTVRPPCNRQLNFMNKPQSGSGGSPFMGDYTGATPSVQFVWDEVEMEWRWATEAADVPNRAFHAIFADNRHLIPPTYPSTSEEWERYQFYGPPEIGGACVNPGSRNTDVLTARIDAELIVSAPTTYKQLNARRGFPIRVQNGTGDDRFYRLTITQGAADASFSADPTPTSTPATSRSIPTPACRRWSMSRPAASDRSGSTWSRSTASTVSPNGGQTGSLVFNPDPNNPSVEGLGLLETQNPFVRNPFVRNPFVRNPFVRNEGASNLSVSNPFVQNPFVHNPFVRNTALDDDPNTNIYDVVDTTWEVGADIGTNTSSSYIPIINIDNAEQFVGNYAFQLIVYKTSTFAGYDDSVRGLQYLAGPDPLERCPGPQRPRKPVRAQPLRAQPVRPQREPGEPVRAKPVRAEPVRPERHLHHGPIRLPVRSEATASALVVADDGTLRAPIEPETIKMTLRAFRLKPLVLGAARGIDRRVRGPGLRPECRRAERRRRFDAVRDGAADL